MSSDGPTSPRRYVEMMRPDAPSSVQVLAKRCAELPRLLQEMLSVALPDEELLDLHHGSRVLVTGAGLAEGPARQLAMLWRSELGLCADFVPLTSFIESSPRTRADTFILISQGLSPNARIAMDRAADFEQALLITSSDRGEDGADLEPLVAWQRQGGAIWSLPPDVKEEGMLLRVQGPTLYAFALHLWTRALVQELFDESPIWGKALEEVPAMYAERFGATLRCAEATERAHLLSAPNLALLSYGACEDRSHGLRWKILEGMWRQAPQVFDLLQVVHGPWQGFYNEPMALLALIDERCPVQRDLLERLEKILNPHHALHVLCAELPAPLGFFEFAAAIDAMLVLENQHLGRDLVQWPGLGKDGPLYGLSSTPVA